MRYLTYQRERCPDTGRLHWQSYCEFKRDQRLTTIQKLLAIGKSHCEKRGGQPSEAAKYCQKEDSRIEPFVEFGVRSADKEKKTDKDSIYRRAHAEPDYETAMAIIRTALPEDYTRSFINIRAALQYKVEKVLYHRELEFGWTLPNSITKWLAEEFTKVERARCLVLIGPTRLGKTAWARSLGRHIHWRIDTAMEYWDDEARYIVIDDIEWKYIPRKKGLLTQMGDFTITDKYMKKRIVNNNKPAIVLLNEKHFNEQYADDDPDYWDHNTTIVRLTETLIDKTQKAINPVVIDDREHSNQALTEQLRRALEDMNE